MVCSPALLVLQFNQVVKYRLERRLLFGVGVVVDDCRQITEGRLKFPIFRPVDRDLTRQLPGFADLSGAEGRAE